MRRITVYLFLCLMLSAFAHAECDPVEQLQQYLKDKHKGDPRQVLALDHKTRRWTGYTWDGSLNLTKTNDGFEELALAKPRVLVGKQPLLVVVTNTNPLLYAARQTAATRTDSADLAGLQQLALSLGGIVSFAATAAGQRGALTLLSLDQTDDPTAAMLRESIARDQEISPGEVDDLEKVFVDALNEQSKTVSEPLGTLKSAAEDLKKHVDAAARQAAALSALVQVVEAGQEPATIAEKLDSKLPQEIEAAFGTLITAREALRAVEPLCTDEAAQAAVAIGHKRFGFPTDPRLRDAAVEQFDKALAALIGAGSKTCDGTARDALRLLGRWLQNAPPRIGQEAPFAQQAALRTMEDAALAYGTVLDKGAAAIAKADESLKARFDPVKAATRVVGIAALRADHDADEPCSLIAGVVEVDRSGNTLEGIPFGKEGNETFVVSSNPAFKEVEKNRGDPVEASYIVAPRRKIDFDIDMAVTYTDLTNPKFEVEEVGDGTNKQFFIRKSDESTRAGNLAAMLSLTVPGLGRVRPQIGAGITSDTPALFAGAALSVGPYFKLSGGWTWQKVTKLANGLSPDQEIESKGEFRTRDGFGDAWYAGVSITLDNVPFFSRD